MTYIAQSSHSLAHSQAITSLVKTIEDRQGMVERTPFPAVQTEQTNVPQNELASTQQVMNPSSSSTTSRSTQYDTLVRTTTTMASSPSSNDVLRGPAAQRATEQYQAIQQDSTASKRPVVV